MGRPKMSAFVDEAVAVMAAKLDGKGFDGVAKFVIRDEGSFVIDQAGARPGDDDADVTLTASAATFQAIFAGDLNPTAAFMTGKLAVDGNMGMAMKLSSLLG
jgi:putative sterol carrier protein